jgi:hypothetical protein
MRPMITEDAFNALVEEAMAAMRAGNKDLRTRFGIGAGGGTWEADLQVPTIRFLTGGKLVATADLVVVGTLAKDAWQWGWGDKALAAHVRAAGEPLKALAKETGLDVFSKPGWDGDEDMAWWCTALACKRLGGEGSYRMPGTDSNVYAVLKNVRAPAP